MNASSRLFRMTTESRTVTFELSDQSHLLGVAALAKALGVTDQTVYNYEAKGMAAQETGPAGEKLWDPVKARAWIEKNGPSSLRGGKRRDAGRKTKEQEEAETKDETLGSLAKVFQEAEERLIASGVPPEIARNAGDIEALMEAVKSETLSLKQIETVHAGLKAAAAMVELQKKCGDLVPIKEAEAEFGQYLSYARITLDNLPGRSTPELVSEFQKVATEMGAALKKLIEKGKTGPNDLAEAMRLPADMAARIRAVLVQQVVIVKKQLQREEK